MKSQLKAGKLFLVGILVLLGSVFSTTASASAASLQPLTISPVCSDASASVSEWEITNPNTASVGTTWTNRAQTATGTLNVTSGTNTYDTAYIPLHSTAKFVTNGVTEILDNPSVCDPGTANTASRQSLQQNLIYTWNNRGSVTISTIDDIPLTGGPITVTLASYVLPANYNGDFFSKNATATPQTLFNDSQITLQNTGEQFLPVTLQVKLPTDCHSTQVDLYMGDEVIQTISANGTIDSNGNPVNLLSGLYFKTADTCSTGHVLGSHTTKPAAAKLTDTGLPVGVTSALATLLMASAIGVVRRKPATEQIDLAL